MNITKNNYEEFLIDHLHGELNGNLLKEMELFLQNNPSVKEEFELLQKTILVPDEKIIFQNKDLLLKNEKSTPLFITYKRPISIAASIVGIVFATYFFTQKSEDTTIAVNENKKIDTVQTIVKMNDSIASTTNLPITATQKNTIVVVKKQTKTNIKSSNIYHQPKKKLIEKLEQKNIPQPEIVVENKEIIIPQKETPFIENKLKEEMPTIIENKKDEALVANNTTSKGAIVLNEKKQPRLFQFINGIMRTSQKIQQKKEQLANTEILVMVGNKKIINLNQN